MTAINESLKRVEQRSWLAKFCNGFGLDVGCGAQKICSNSIGIDLGTVEGRKPDLIARAYELPFPPKSIDFIVSCHLLEHIADTKRALAEFWRVLKLEGICAAVVPHGEEFKNAVWTVEHLSAFTPITLSEFFRACGFEVLGEARFLEEGSVCWGLSAVKVNRLPRYRPEGEDGLVWLGGKDWLRGRSF